ncbi:hypothetical protein [Pseudomonas sp.]|uniref:hypothetical protein n=1 Tax=Pseudomonas sp. TaxID=306 RepID=UPI001A0D4F7C|nr:hypothetical protein [Pseudomonas sp.]MBF0675597.1 hypothetical protein [Pseudomonas sp.]
MSGWIDRYLRATYRDGARGPDEYDCWGLARAVRHEVYGCRLLPSWGHVRHDMPREFTRAYRNESAAMQECAPEPGAIAAVFRGQIVVHVGVVIEVDGGLAVFDIRDISTSPRWQRIHDFESRYLRVLYYRD